MNIRNYDGFVVERSVVMSPVTLGSEPRGIYFVAFMAYYSMKISTISTDFSV